MRVLGPGSGGIVVPARGLNASAAPVRSRRGRLRWSASRRPSRRPCSIAPSSKGIGFSTVLHLGASLDVDLADVLDWLAADRTPSRSWCSSTKSPPDASSCRRRVPPRATSRWSPFAADRVRHGARDQRHSPPTTSTRRPCVAPAGCASTPGRSVRSRRGDGAGAPAARRAPDHPGNGHGLGRIAGDTLLRSGGSWAASRRDTFKHLEELLQTRSALSNPLALPPDVRPEPLGGSAVGRARRQPHGCRADGLSPSPFAASADVATAICEVSGTAERNVFTCWVGGAACSKRNGLPRRTGC
jgi:acetyltransferase